MRDAPRLHVVDRLDPGATVRPDEARTHYLRHVLRLGDGASVRLFNASSGEWDARIEPDGRRAIRLVVSTRRRAALPAREAPRPTLLFAPLKRDATDLVVRMATELGAGAIRPVLTARTVAGRVNGERLASIAREAAEQCERLDVPVTASPVPLAALLADWTDGTIAAAIERAAAARPLGTPRAGHPAPRALLIGPEGGFAPDELDLLGAALFIEPVSLGALVLRAETAAAAGLALLRAEHGATTKLRDGAEGRERHVEPG